MNTDFAYALAMSATDSCNPSTAACSLAIIVRHLHEHDRCSHLSKNDERLFRKVLAETAKQQPQLAPWGLTTI